MDATIARVTRLSGDLNEFLGRCPAFDCLASAVAVFDRTGLRYANPAFAGLNASVRDVPTNFPRFRSLLDCPGLSGWLSESLASGEARSICQRVYYSRLVEVELTFCLEPLVDGRGRCLGGILTIGEESIAHGRHHLARQQESHRRLVARIQELGSQKAKVDQLLRLLLREAPTATVIINEQRQVIQVNRAAEDLFRIPAREFLGRTCEIFLNCMKRHGQCPALVHGRLAGDLCGGVLADEQQLIVLRSAAVLESDGTNVIVESFVDITERHVAESRVAHLAHHDLLTGLLNRFSLQDRLDQALASARRDRKALALLFIDMDRFKTINDTLGHAAGDALLVEVAKRLRRCARESDIVARFGGDEFVVVLTGIDGPAAAAHVADKMLRVLGEPYEAAFRTLYSTPSIGIAVYPDDGRNGEALMKNADRAMYHAKEQGRNNVRFFTPQMSAEASRLMTLQHDLRVALDRGQFELHYQPQVYAADNRVCGVEALIRWRHPEQGMLAPALFVPVAEDMGLIEALGSWVLDEACRQFAAWKGQGVPVERVAVNLSAHQLRSPDVVDMVRDAMARHSLCSGELELEITESVAMADPEHSIGRLIALRKLGVELAIDDFGTGYSSLAYLKMLPIQTLKLDRAFVGDLENDENDAAICAATLALAHTLELKVVAEGVETEPQRAFLASHNCDILQGFLIGKPLPAIETAAFLAGR